MASMKAANIVGPFKCCSIMETGLAAIFDGNGNCVADYCDETFAMLVVDMLNRRASPSEGLER